MREHSLIAGDQVYLELKAESNTLLVRGKANVNDSNGYGNFTHGNGLSGTRCEVVFQDSGENDGAQARNEECNDE